MIPFLFAVGLITLLSVGKLYGLVCSVRCVDVSLDCHCVWCLAFQYLRRRKEEVARAVEETRKRLTSVRIPSRMLDFIASYFALFNVFQCSPYMSSWCINSYSAEIKFCTS